MQDGTLDAAEYLPPGHAVHVVAPVPAPVLVMDPAAQVEQSDCWVLSFWLWYVPALQSVHVATFDAVEYLPPAQPRHIRSAMFVPLVVTN